jgi:hypothetical protein
MKTQRLLAVSFALAIVPSLSAQVTTTTPGQPPVIHDPQTQAPPPQTQAPTNPGTSQSQLPVEMPSSKPTGQYNAPTQEENKPVVIPDRKLTNEGKMNLIRGMTAELGFARKPFPMGKTGLKLEAKSGAVTPNDQQLEAIMAGYGPALKAGDRARITDIKIKDKSIIFEINGGPQRKKKWYEHIEVSGMGGTVQPGQPTDNTNVRGSYVELSFDKFVPDLKPEEIKRLLDPVVNFHAKSATEAYLDTIPPVAKKAISDHRALVGMNREMVTYAKGRPPQKHRERDGDVDYEEWIYGVPPQEVEFIRFVGDEVIRIETMKVDGTKMVRTDREVTIPKEQPEVAQTGAQPPAPGTQPAPAGQTQPAPAPTPASTGSTSSSDDGPKGRPTLKRPGEETSGQPGPSAPNMKVPQTPPLTGPDPSTDPIPKGPGN